MKQSPLIAPKHLTEFDAEEYYAYVSSMYERPVSKGKSPAPGLSLGKTAAGALSVRRNKKQRAFDYVTQQEIEALAKDKSVAQADVWNAFRARGFIIATTRMEAEQVYERQVRGRVEHD